MKLELVCPECKIVKPLKMIEGEPCMEYPDRADDPADFLSPGWVSLHRWIRYQCLFGPHHDCPPDIPFFDIPEEFAPGLIRSCNSFKPANGYGYETLLANTTERAVFLLGRINEIVEAEKQVLKKHPELELLESVPPENDSTRYHRKKWQIKVCDNVTKLRYDVAVWRYLCERMGEAKRAYSWTETMSVSVPYAVLPLGTNLPWFPHKN